MPNILVSPSILSANYAHLGADLEELNRASADWIHCDVMDGLFVPNISFGQKVIQDIRSYSSLPFDVHLMIMHPLRYVREFAAAGADLLTIHYEACEDASEVQQTLRAIRSCGKRCGLSVKPNTAIREITPFLNQLDLVLVMSVEPGFGGQAFLPGSLEKIEQLKAFREQHGYEYLIEVDGGINLETAPLARKAGADVLVAGSAVFRAENKGLRIRQLKGE